MAGGSMGGYWDQYPPHVEGQPPAPNPGVPQAPPPATAAPAAASGGGPGPITDYRSQFMQIMGGLPATPANLESKEAELQAAGFRIVRSGDGTAGKVALPNGGPIMDVIHGSHAGGGGEWQWLGPGGAGGQTMGTIGQYQTGQFTGGGQYPLSPVIGPGLAAPWLTPFTAPTDVTEQNDPGFQFRLKEAQNAIERSAASRGTLLSGGLLKRLSSVMQDQASAEYGNVYGRAMGEYNLARGIYGQNASDTFNRLGYLGSVGENAAAGVGNVQQGIGNAQAAGTAAGGAAYGNAVQQVGNIGASVYQQTQQPAPAQPATYYPGGYTSPYPYVPGTTVPGGPAGTW